MRQSVNGIFQQIIISKHFYIDEILNIFSDRIKIYKTKKYLTSTNIYTTSSIPEYNSTIINKITTVDETLSEQLCYISLICYMVVTIMY